MDQAEVIETRESKKVCTDFQEVRSYSDLAEVVFSIDSDRVNWGWSWDGNKKPGEPGKVKLDTKIEWLLGEFKYRLDEWWVFDSDKAGHNLGEIARQINPNWQEGDSLFGDLPEQEKRLLIRKAWEKAQDNRSESLAEKLGGRSIKLSNPSMESGISSFIVLPTAENIGNEEILFRGYRNQDLRGLNEQVSGMLR